MKQHILYTLIFSLLTFQITAQDSLKKKSPINYTIDYKILDNGQLADQFDFMLKYSNSYKNYHVIKDDWLTKFKSHVIDSINKLKTEHAITKEKLTTVINENNALKSELKANEEVISQKNTLPILGLKLEKSSYQWIVWSLIGLLSLLLGYYIYKFKNSHVLTKNAMQSYEELETEFNDYRSRALEREQILNRKLFDEQKKNNHNDTSASKKQ